MGRGCKARRTIWSEAADKGVHALSVEEGERLYSSTKVPLISVVSAQRNPARRTLPPLFLLAAAATAVYSNELEPGQLTLRQRPAPRGRALS